MYPNACHDTQPSHDKNNEEAKLTQELADPARFRPSL